MPARGPEDVPAYTLLEAADLVGVAPSTLRSWVRGRSFPKRKGEGRSPAVIRPPVVAGAFLSFTNVVEAHVLSGLRRRYDLKLDAIRTAVRYVHERLDVEHPLATEQFKTDGVSLFVDRFGRLINVSREGQLAMREVLDAYLERIEYGDHRAVRFFPLLREAAPRVIVVDPRRAFGRPIIAGTSVPVTDIRSRFDAGDSIDAARRRLRAPRLDPRSRKPSVRRRRLPEPFTFFVDECLGRQVAAPRAARRSPAGRRARREAARRDDRRGRHGFPGGRRRRWITCLTKDHALKRRPNELEAIRRAGAGIFLLGEASGEAQAQRILAALSVMRRVARTHDLAFIARIEDDGKILVLYEAGERLASPKRLRPKANESGEPDQCSFAGRFLPERVRSMASAAQTPFFSRWSPYASRSLLLRNLPVDVRGICFITT